MTDMDVKATFAGQGNSSLFRSANIVESVSGQRYWSTGIEGGVYWYREAIQERRGCDLVTVKDTMLGVRVTLQPEHNDSLILGIDNPILGDPCLSIVGSLHLRITIGIIWANDFDNQIGAKPVAILSARIVRVTHEQNIWFTVLAVSNLEAQRSILDFAADALDKCQERQKDELRDGLVFIRRHGQHFDITVVEFEQTPAVIGHRQVLLLGPETLDRPQI